jgi:hypothetical protein
MFEEFKSSIGVGAPAEETWHCDPLVVVDENDDILWGEAATVRYMPGSDKYEGGVGRATTPNDNQTIVDFKLLQIHHRDPLGIAFPLLTLMPWGESGVTIDAVGSDGRPLTLHTGSHASSYLKNRASGETPAEPSPLP